jgi:hypothetical protein
MDTVRKMLIFELKLFADAMLKQLGRNYFIMRKQHAVSKCVLQHW